MSYKKIAIIALGLCLLAGCKDKSVYYSIEQPADHMHLSASASEVQLSVASQQDTAITFRWTWPATQPGSMGYTYYFKMDIADNDMRTAIPKMAISGDNSISFTHKQMNDMLEKWSIKAGMPATLTAELLAQPEGMEHYVKPMISTVNFRVIGYSTFLYVCGSATAVGTDPTHALVMVKDEGADIFRYTGLLQEGTFWFPTMNTSNCDVYGKGYSDKDLRLTPADQMEPFHNTRLGYYSLVVNTTTNKLSRPEPLYLIGSATEAGWDLSKAVPMTNVTDYQLRWSGTLQEGELKFACNPSSGLFEDPFYQSDQPNAPADGEAPMVFNPDATGIDNKWYVTESNTYTITVDLSKGIVSFERDHSRDDLPFKNVWIVGDGTPGGWWCPFREQMDYTPSEGKGVFSWSGTLYAGEIKFPLQSSSWQGDFFMAPTAGMPISTSGPMELVYTATGEPDNKFTIQEGGEYTVQVNVIEQTVLFIKR